MTGGMAPLAGLLARRIALTGPLTLAEYMAECLLHPQHGYYTTRPPFGAAGDFVTAPEISQMFGELLGLCLAQGWIDQGRPAPFVLAEPGPGRGTLMADVLRATAHVPGFHAAVRLHLVEASPALRAQQAERLQAFPAIAPVWDDSLDALPQAPLLLIANEFFDALPVRQFTRTAEGWAETVVGLRGGRLAAGRAAPVWLEALEPRRADTVAGDVVETCPAAGPAMAAIAGRIARHGGLALVVDYGGWGGTGDTFQALRGHARADPFAEPGRADLTAHVDFRALSGHAAAAGAVCPPLVTQGALLERLGIGARAAALGAGSGGAALEQHRAAHRRLTHPQEMGSLFKALAVIPRGAPLPAGFAP